MGLSKRFRTKGAAVAFWVVYTVLVLGIDTLATRRVDFLIDWRVFSWRLDSGFDVYRFVAWFVIPFALCLPGIEWSWLSFKRWKRGDFIFLALVIIIGALAMLIIPHVPALSRTYSGFGAVSFVRKLLRARWMLVWTFSWLVGWEFLHRYALLRSLRSTWPLAWLLIPLSEGLYHYVQTKPPLECLGMVAFSLVLTPWALKRRNVLLPFCAHLIIELELIAFLLLT